MAAHSAPQAGPNVGKASRNQAIETLRIVAAFGIVAFHSGAPFHDLAYSGLIVFLILAPLADVRFNLHRVRSIGRLAQALMIPWAFWWIIYGIFNVVTHKGFFATGNPLVGLFYGTSAHLWFLPYIFVVLALLNAVKQRASLSMLLWIFTVAAAALLVTVTTWRAPSLTWWPPLPQWIHALPAVCIGIVLGLSGQVGKSAILAVAIVAGALLVAVSAHLDGIGVPYAVGTVLTMIALSVPAKWLPAGYNVQPIADCMFGVFLTHLIWLTIFPKFVGAHNYLTVTLAFATALVTVFAARRLVPISRSVLG